MNRENIIKLAKESGFYIKDNEIYSMSTQSDHELTEWIERFASLVAQQEREQCARVCEELETCSDAEFYGHEFSAAIRARKSQ